MNINFNKNLLLQLIPKKNSYMKVYFSVFSFKTYNVSVFKSKTLYISFSSDITIIFLNIIGILTCIFENKLSEP